jgi:hypothetical protein
MLSALKNCDRSRSSESGLDNQGRARQDFGKIFARLVVLSGSTCDLVVYSVPICKSTVTAIRTDAPLVNYPGNLPRHRAEKQG